jgi:hypothetical protein
MAWDPAEYSLSSGEKTADALIMSGSGWFHQILVTPDGTNAVTVTVYDNTSGSGTKVIETMTFAGDGGTQATPPIWIYCSTGIYVDVTVAGGGSVAYAALYRKR